MEKMSFKVSSRTAVLMGRENIANSEGALIELVKNSYDADSGDAILLFEKDCIILIDNGEGMTKDVIKNKWMVIGTDNKVKDYITKKGRIKSGAKGIGRLALDKLGKESTIITSTSKEMNKWNIIWDEFEDNSKTIDEIQTELKSINDKNFKEVILENISSNTAQKIIENLEINNGTFIKISNLRDEWDLDKIEILSKGLEMLIPIYNDIGFKIKLVDSEDNLKNIKFSEFTNYDYKLSSQIINNKIEITLKRNEFDKNVLGEDFFNLPELKEEPEITINNFEEQKYLLDLSDITMKITDKELKEIGDFSFDLFYLKKDDKSSSEMKEYIKTFNPRERKVFLDRYSGIKIYRDNFLIRPYGQKGSGAYDWLGLGERVNSNPTGIGGGGPLGGWNAGPSNLMGIIKISRVNNSKFEDKSSREGILESYLYQKFKELVINIIEFLETDRQKIYRAVKGFAKKDFEDIEAESEEIIEKIKKEKNNKKNSKEEEKSKEQKKENFEEFYKEYKKLEDVTLAIKEKNEELMGEIALLRTYASSGLMLSSLSHEIKNIVCKGSLTRLTGIERLFMVYKDKMEEGHQELSQKTINTLKDDYKKIEGWIDFSLNLIKRDKRRRKDVNLFEFFKEVEKSWDTILDEYRIKLSMNIEEKLYLKCFKSDLESIFVNLIVNSIDAFQLTDKQIRERKIIISIKKSKENNIFIEYQDNGPGLNEKIKNPRKILEPNFSTKVDEKGLEVGIGLGMSIVKSIIDSYKGEIDIKKSKDGFYMSIKIDGVKEKEDR